MIQMFEKLNPLAVIIIVSILSILFASFIASIIIRSRYKKIGEALEKIKTGSLEGDELLTGIVEDYRKAAKDNMNEVNTQAIIERNFNDKLKGMYLAERFIKHSISLMIILGLLGTFYGLTLSIGRLVELLADSGNAEMLGSMDSIVEGLINSVRGMSVAFVTSLFGIGSSIILTVLNIFLNIEEVRESLMVQIEEYLDNTVSLEFSKDKINEYSMVTNALRETLEQFGGKVDENFKNMVENSTSNLINVAGSIEKAAFSLVRTMESFDKTVDKFNENTRDFAEFNHHLRTNIERMNVSLSDFTDDLKYNIKNIPDSNDFAKEIATSSDKVYREE